MKRALPRNFALLLVAFLALVVPARADWFAADLPYGDYLGEPVSGLAPAGVSDLWAVSPYGYPYQDKDHVRWNSLAYRSLNDGRLFDLPWDAPSNAEPNSVPFQDTQLFAGAFAGRDTGFLFGWQRPAFGSTDPPGPYAFYRTTDRGQSWTISTLPNTGTAAPDDLDFALDATDATHALAAQGRHVFETADGSAWRERPGAFPRFFALQTRGLPVPRVAGTDGVRAVAGTLTPNGFVADLTADGVFHATRFADAMHGWVAGGTVEGSAGTVYGTADGGHTWTLQARVPNVLFRGLAAVDGSRAWAVGERTGTAEDAPDRGVIYRTDDGGKTWRFEHAAPGRLYAVAFRDAIHGWASGEGGLYRYVPDVPLSAPGDMDRNGQTDATDVTGILARAGGLRVAAGDDLRSGAENGAPLSVADALAALRSALTSGGGASSEGAHAVVVYNTISTDRDGNGRGDSEDVARYYALRRGVPEANLVPITWADSYYFSRDPYGANGPRSNWTDAYKTVVEPLRARIDALGRDMVDTIVFTLDVPFAFVVHAPDGTQERVTLDGAVQDLYGSDPENWVSANPYGASFASVAERYGRSPFGQGGRPMGQPVLGADGSVSRGPYYLVGRIDGPGLDACRAMVDNALFAERYYGRGGYDGVAYVDDRAQHYNAPAFQPYSLDELRGYTPVYDGYGGYDKSIARTVLTFEDRGLPWREEVTYASIGAPPAEGNPVFRDGAPALSAPRAMFYAGWYNYGRYYDVFDWLPGSVGIDFDSASAASFRSDQYFAGGALSAGLTALLGVLEEPYNYHPKPDALMEYLARGFRLGEAAALATDTPRLAHALLLGDPLYRPFGHGTALSVPVPKLDIVSTATPNGWTVTLTSDIPVRATLQYAAGADPGIQSPSMTGVPRFFARQHTFAVPAGTGVRVLVHATDPTGRVTDSPSVRLP